MKWNHFLAALFVALPAVNCLAEMPDFAGDRIQAMSLVGRARILSGQNWWSRFGEPVNAAALAQADTSPSDNGAIAGPMPIYGNGYVFAPGSCDCPPPCIGQLWAGYFQNPWRCNPDGHGLLHHRHGCGACGAYAGGGGLFGHGCGCGPSCTAKACGCATPVTCTTAAPDCGCKPVCGKCRHCHLGSWHGFAAHWTKSCNSCSLPVSCGCTTPVGPLPGLEKQAGDKIPAPLPDEAVLYPLSRLN